MSTDLVQELQQRVRDLERAATITAKLFGAQPPQDDYAVTVRPVAGVLHVFLGAGSRLAVGGAITTDAEQDLGAYVSGRTVYIKWTWSTDTVPGSFGDWTYAATPAADPADGTYWLVATITTDATTGRRTIRYHRRGMVRIHDARLCVNCGDDT